jgi:hypothetical protein
MSDLARALLAEIDEDTLDALVQRLAPLLREQLALTGPRDDGWLDAKRAADYLSISANAIHRLTSARQIPFEQDGPGCKCWFRRSELDTWRRGEWRRAA